MAAPITKSPPWETFYNEVVALFKGDKDIKVVKAYTDDEKRIRILVGDREKYRLLDKYVVPEKLFGVVKVIVEVVDANGSAKTTPADDMRALFAGNHVVSRIKTTTIPGGTVTYVAFNNGVVQFKDDNLADINGNKTMLMEAIARDVFKLPVDGVYFCTDTPREYDSVLDDIKRERGKKATDILDKLFNSPFC